MKTSTPDANDDGERQQYATEWVVHVCRFLYARESDWGKGRAQCTPSRPIWGQRPAVAGAGLSRPVGLLAGFHRVRNPIGFVTGSGAAIGARCFIDGGIHIVDLIADRLASAIDILVPL